MFYCTSDLDDGGEGLRWMCGLGKAMPLRVNGEGVVGRTLLLHLRIGRWRRRALSHIVDVKNTKSNSSIINLEIRRNDLILPSKKTTRVEVSLAQADSDSETKLPGNYARP